MHTFWQIGICAFIQGIWGIVVQEAVKWIGGIKAICNADKPDGTLYTTKAQRTGCVTDPETGEKY